MCAFKPDLNLARDDDDLRFNGSLFHSFGANTPHVNYGDSPWIFMPKYDHKIFNSIFGSQNTKRPKNYSSYAFLGSWATCLLLFLPFLSPQYP